MTDWFLSGGFIMWPLLVLAIGVVALAVRAAVTLRRASTAAADPERGAAPVVGPRSLGAILFWGAVAFLVGALGTVVGIVIMARNISAAGGASAGLVWGGVGVALVSLVFGILVFLLSGFLWLALDGWRRRLAERSGSAATAWLLVAVVGFTAACGEADDGRFVVTDSAGITLAENVGPDRPFPATPVRLATLQAPDSALTAMPWGVAADPSTGRIFVADGTSERVVVFAADGGFVRTIGRAGGGPGEFRHPTAVALDESGALAVWDARRGIISRWSAEGDLLNEQRAPVSYWGPGFSIRRNGVLAVTQSTNGDERRQSLVEATAGSDPAELFAVTRELVRMDLPNMNMPAPRIFAPDLIWTTAGDTVLVLNGPDYRIEGYAEGRRVSSIRRDIAPIPVTGEMAAARVAAGPYQGFMRTAGLTVDQIVAAVGYEDVTSPVEWLSVDPSGRLWVSRGSGGPIPDRVDILDSDGRYLGTFDAPGLPVAFLSASTFVALEVTELGQPALGLYRLGTDDT